MNDFVAAAVGNCTFMQQLGSSIPLSLLAELKRRVMLDKSAASSLSISMSQDCSFSKICLAQK